MIVAYTPRKAHPIVNDFTFVRDVSFRDFKLLEGLAEAFTDREKYAPSTSIWIVPGTYKGE